MMFRGSAHSVVEYRSGKSKPPHYDVSTAPRVWNHDLDRRALLCCEGEYVYVAIENLGQDTIVRSTSDLFSHDNSVLEMAPMKDNRAIGMLDAAREGKYGIVGACCVSKELSKAR